MSESHEPVAAVSHDVSSEQVQQIKKHLTRYWMTSGTQIGFIFLTVIVSLQIRSTFTQAMVTLLLAAINGTIVAAILMHLKEEKRTIWKFLIFTGIFFVVLFFLTFLARTDPITGTSHTHH